MFLLVLLNFYLALFLELIIEMGEVLHHLVAVIRYVNVLLVLLDIVFKLLDQVILSLLSCSSGGHCSCCCSLAVIFLFLPPSLVFILFLPSFPFLLLELLLLLQEKFLLPLLLFDFFLSFRFLLGSLLLSKALLFGSFSESLCFSSLLGFLFFDFYLVVFFGWSCFV